VQKQRTWQRYKLGVGVTLAIAEFWGKARPDLGAHPLLAHSLDVAAVDVLMSRRGPLQIEPRMLGFLVSLHDVGKFPRPFRAKARANWPVSILGSFTSDDIPPPGPSHDTP
jgi:CRISPR-associated endonuclease/helicase Cas3